MLDGSPPRCDIDSFPGKSPFSAGHHPNYPDGNIATYHAPSTITAASAILGKFVRAAEAFAVALGWTSWQQKPIALYEMEANILRPPCEPIVFGSEVSWTAKKPKAAVNDWIWSTVEQKSRFPWCSGSQKYRWISKRKKIDRWRRIRQATEVTGHWRAVWLFLLLQDSFSRLQWLHSYVEITY